MIHAGVAQPRPYQRVGDARGDHGREGNREAAGSVSAADVPVDLALRSRAAHLLVAGRGVLAGYSAAEVLGASCGPVDAPAEVALPAGCPLRQRGLRVHRGLLLSDEVTAVDAERARRDLERQQRLSQLGWTTSAHAPSQC